jgi:SAM-dependent methyltransferase
MTLADWQLPPGVNRGLWDYLHSPDVARGYDAYLSGVSLCDVDLAFVARHCPTQGRLLDLGCGTGRLLIEFARRGYWTLGVDLSAEMLAVADEKAAACGLAVERLQANLTQLDCLADKTFDYAACLFSTLGMVIGAEQRRRVVAHAARLLRPGGKFILHVHNRWFNVWNSAGRVWLMRDLLGLRPPGVERGDRVMPVHQGVAGLTLHLFTRSETIRLLHDAGLRVVEEMPVSLRSDGRLPAPWWFGSLRAYGYLIAAQRVPREPAA